MRVTVKIDDIEVTIERPNFGDDGVDKNTLVERRTNIMKDTIIPTLEQAITKAKDLHEFRKHSTL